MRSRLPRAAWAMTLRQRRLRAVLSTDQSTMALVLEHRAGERVHSLVHHLRFEGAQHEPWRQRVARELRGMRKLMRRAHSACA